MPRGRGGIGGQFKESVNGSGVAGEVGRGNAAGQKPAAGRFVGQDRRECAEAGGWERRTGMRLRFVFRRGGPSLLVADNARLTKRGLARANTGRTRSGAAYTRLAGRSTVVVFLLVPQVTLKKRFDIANVAQRWADRVPGVIASRWRST